MAVWGSECLVLIPMAGNAERETASMKRFHLIFTGDLHFSTRNEKDYYWHSGLQLHFISNFGDFMM